MGIIYIATLIALMISFILIKKTEQKLNILGFVAITIGVTFCYNTFISYILTFFTIPVTLGTLSLINTILFAILMFFIVKKKQVQEYEIHKIDILYILLLAIVVLIISYINFGFPFNIKYETGDPSVHYLTADMFSENDSLLVKAQDEVYVTFRTRKTVSYVNSGLIMKCFQNVIDSYYNYNIFIMFGIFVLFMTAWAMYTTISAFSKDKKTRFLAFVLSLIYTIGYPLNSFLFGFEYLSMGIFIVCLIFDMVNYFQNKELKIFYNMLIFALLNFGLFSAYYMFVPFIYPALWIYFCIYSYEKDKSIFTKKNILLLIVTLLIPFLLGYIYHLTPDIYDIFIGKELNVDTMFNYSSHVVGEGLAAKGYIYVNLYSNMLLLIPIPIYLIIKKFKENKFATICMIFCIAFIELLLIGFMFGKVSTYYSSKNYFILWFILFYLNYKGIIEIYKKYTKVAFGLVGVYSLIIALNLLFIDTKLENVELNRNERITTVAEVFGVNKTILKHSDTDLYDEELQILKFFQDNIDKKAKTEVVGDMEQGFWTYTLTRYVNKEEENYKPKSGQNTLEVKMINVINSIEDADYIIYFKRSYLYSILNYRIHELGNTIYENEYGGIVKCK